VQSPDRGLNCLLIRLTPCCLRTYGSQVALSRVRLALGGVVICGGDLGGPTWRSRWIIPLRAPFDQFMDTIPSALHDRLAVSYSDDLRVELGHDTQ
jgi:hypothetical protein